MRRARVEYPSGREVLKDYWGYLSSGGLIVGDRSFSSPDEQADPGEAMAAGGVADGDAVVLDVHIRSLRKQYQLPGHVRKTEGGRAVIAFDDGVSQDLLNAAWADGQGVPERRHHRWNVKGDVRYRVGDRPGRGRLVNASRGGLCLVTDVALRGGARVVVDVAGATAEGQVRWARRNGLVGIEFARFQEELVARLVNGEPEEPDATPDEERAAL